MWESLRYGRPWNHIEEVPKSVWLIRKVILELETEAVF